MSILTNTLLQFRVIAFIEGVSYLMLLFIAMPMKYMFDIPEATKIIGMTHGILFIIFIFILLKAQAEHKWNIVWSSAAFISSLIPFGTFFIDKKIKLMMNEEFKKALGNL